MTCFVSRPSGITLVKFHSLQVTIKTNLLAELMDTMELRGVYTSWNWFYDVIGMVSYQR